MNSDARGLGTVPSTQTVRLEHGIDLDAGGRLEVVDVAYEQYGALNACGDNALLVCHALSGGAHAAGYHEGAAKPGWWDVLIGPGKAFDTNRYCVICINVLGSCYGTTGPASAEPATGRPYGSRFPDVTIGDMVRVQKAVLDGLGVRRLAAVAGGSMGGMQALLWPVLYPDFVEKVVALATTDRHSPQQIAFGEIARRAVMADPAWRGGDYYGQSAPAAGLAVARMLGHVTYLADAGMHRKFGRRVKNRADAGERVRPQFEVEAYLEHQGQSFVERFDANALIALSRALDDFDLGAGFDSLADAFLETDATFLLLTFSSDWLYAPYQLARVADALRQAGRSVQYHELATDYGHDAFLLEHAAQTPIIKAFLAEHEDRLADGLSTFRQPADVQGPWPAAI